jgi:hypothetical protein
MVGREITRPPSLEDLPGRMHMEQPSTLGTLWRMRRNRCAGAER